MKFHVGDICGKYALHVKSNRWCEITNTDEIKGKMPTLGIRFDDNGEHKTITLSELRKEFRVRK